MMRAGTQLPDGRRVTGRRPYRQSGLPMLWLGFSDGTEWRGRENADVAGSAAWVPGVRTVLAGPTRGGRNIPTQQLYAATARPRRKRVGTPEGYERLVERMTY